MGKLKLQGVKQPDNRLKAVFLAILSTSVLCLAFSLLAQIWGDLKPCRLCLIQRYLFVGLACISILGCFRVWVKFNKKMTFLILCAGLLISFYHTLVYFGVIEIKCLMQKNDALDLTTFNENFIQRADCSNQMLVVLGVPASLANSLIFMGCAMLLKYQKRDKENIIILKK